MKYLLIYNPVSGKTGSKTKQLGNIISGLAENGNEVVVYQTQYKNDAREYCSKICNEHYDKIICCGGDGTLHEVVNGMLFNDIKIPLGYIPSGSTNDYAKNLGITPNNALQCIGEGNVQKLDMGKFNGEYFNYVAAFGAFTEVPFSTPQKNKNMLGYLAYLLEGVKCLASIKPYHMKCFVDKTVIEDDFLIGMITNTFSVAGVKSRNSVQTKLDDGKMEYLFIKMPQHIADLQHIMLNLVDSNIDTGFMYYGQASEFKIESDMMAWTLDGEAGGNMDKVEIKVCSQILSVVTGV